MSDDLTLNDGSKRLDPNKNDYFLVTITDLLPGKTYPVEFRWNYKDSTKKGEWGAVLNIVTPGYAPGAPIIVSATWPKDIFTLVFTHDRSLFQNINVVRYKITLIATDLTERSFDHVPSGNETTHTFSRNPDQLIAAFKVPINALSGHIVAVDKNGIESPKATFALVTATADLPAAEIDTLTGSALGYTVAYTTPSLTVYPNYSYISVEEVISQSMTDPGTGYSVSYAGSENPAVVARSSGGKRWVRARFYNKSGLAGPYGAAKSTTPTPAVAANTPAPIAPTPGNASAGIDPNGTIGFNGYINLSWTAVNDSNLRGYRIRFRVNGSNDPYSYADSPGTGTTFRLQGLAVGTTYELGIASYNLINDVSALGYNTFTATTVSGTPFIGTNVNTTGYFSAGTSPNDFQFGFGIDPSNNSNTFSGTKRGLYFTPSNYWVIDSAQTAKFKLGGSTSNFVQWQNNILSVDGDITVKGGKFSGDVQIENGKLWAGTSANALNRLEIASSGISAYGGGIDTTNIYSTPQTLGTGSNQIVASFKTVAALIADWVISSNSIYKFNNANAKIELDSANAQLKITGSGGTAVFTAPSVNNSSGLVLYVGNPNLSGWPNTAPFRVTADGSVTMTSATITGYATGADLSTGLSGKINSGGAANDIVSNSTTITGGNISTGNIRSAGYNYISGNFSQNGMEINLDNGRVRAPNFAIDSNGSAFFKGTIEGSVITTTGGNTYGAIRMNSANDAFEFLSGSTVVGSMFTWNQGEILIQRQAAGSFASDTGYVSIYSTGVSLGRTNLSGTLSTGFNIDGGSPSITAFAGSGGFIVSGGPIYTGTNTTIATDQSEGISLTQGGTISARRNNANPLNLHRYSVTAATTTSVAMIDFYRNGTARGTLEVFGNTSAPVLVGSSDYRLKENIRDYTGGLDKILSTKVRIFNEIEDEDKNDIVGFVAHEFSEIFPDFVSGEKDAIDLEGNPIYQKLSHSNMVPYLVSAIQELSKRLDELNG